MVVMEEKPNVLYGTRVYTMGPMEYSDGQDWRVLVKKFLNPRGITVFDPYHKPFLNEISENEEARALLKKWMEVGEYDKVAHRMKQVRSDDLRLCDVSDFGIVQIKPNTPTFGTMEELSNFNRSKKPLFIFVEGGKSKCPVWIMGMIPHKYIYPSIEDVLCMIERIDDAVVPIDSDRWRLLAKEYHQCPNLKKN